MPAPAHAFNWMSQPFDEDEATHAPLLSVAAQYAAALRGDEWQAAEGPAGRTAHLRGDSRDVFTIGVCEAGDIYLRYDTTGAVIHLPHVDADSTADSIAEDVTAYIDDLY